MAVENLPTLEEVTKQLEEANAKKGGTATPAVKPRQSGIPDEPDIDLPPEVKAAEKGAEAPESLPGTEEEKPVEAKPQDDAWSKKFAAMTRLDKKRRDAERAFSDKVAAFEQKQKDAETREAARLKITNPIEALKHHGFSYEDASYAILGQPAAKPVDPFDERLGQRVEPLDRKMQEIQAKLDAVNQATEQLQAAQAAQQQREVLYAIKSQAESGEYPYLQGLGDEAHQGVYDIMVAYYQKHKQYLTYKQACDRLEGYYKRIGSAGNTKKDTVTATTTQTTQGKEPAQSKTLTQSHNAGTRTKPNTDEMSDREAKDYLAKNVLKYR